MMLFMGFLLLLIGLVVSSSHFLMVLLLVEFSVILLFLFMVVQGFSWFMPVMYLLVAVCMGAYGVCLLISSGRSLGGPYLMAFFI